MQELRYPFNPGYILRKRKAIKKALTSDKDAVRLKKKIAVLGGSTTHDIIDILELFLLDQGIAPEFYESEYGQYWEDAMFDNPGLKAFCPDIIYIHTSSRNISVFPSVTDSNEAIDALLDNTYRKFETMWSKLEDDYHCQIIQNNFEQPYFRLLGNSDFSDPRGHLNFINRLNQRFALYAASHDSFFIQDINYISSCYGLKKWSDPEAWYMYKYACALEAVPELCHNLSNIIKAIYGKSKKALVLDLDNTLWGGVVGEDGADSIDIGQENPVAQIFSEFQSYIKAHKDLGILLAVNSKNDPDNAIAGLNRPDSVLRPDDFLSIIANWDNKDINMRRISDELNIGMDSFVFVDDNPAERELIRTSLPEIEVPEITEPAGYINMLDRSGFFEVTKLSKDDIERNLMYKENLSRKHLLEQYTDYNEYLLSLEMKAEIQPFSQVYMARISQLTNKSNQFNLTTRRCSQSDIENYASSPEYITLYGKLDDKFGSNGVVSVVFAHLDKKDPSCAHIELWLMSCRVLKRNMEYAMMDELIHQCRARQVSTVYGYYYPTKKNSMVKDFYNDMGFDLIETGSDGSTVWQYDIPDIYNNKNEVIRVNE